jgi:glycosyltransferase involved in cell wall biosynthesis/SAM-dependent methyltransferase
MMHSDVPILIPAYKPGESLPGLVRALLDLGVRHIVVVDDGSGPEFREIFRAVSLPGVHLVEHAVNLGKGAALKTGLNFALVKFPRCRGVVTADADGQHHPEDIVRVAARLHENPESLVMGVRSFGERVPLRSRLGNGVTRVLMRVVMGQNLADTQTGLRGIPASLIPHLLRLASAGYEFELDMLIACKHQGCPVLQETIRTIYLDGNKSSHFHPIFDSMRIYFLLFRFSVLSVLTAVLDNVVFALTLPHTGNIAQSQIAARFVAMLFNYLGARRVVFHSRQRHAVVLPKYVFLVLVNGVFSYALIRLFINLLGLSPIPAKLTAEGLLFIANFAIQRDFVFTRRKSAPAATDWDRYYTSVPATAKLTRRYTTAALVRAIRRHAAPAAGEERLSILEIGGANSCFLDSILAEVGCARYDIVDINRYGLDLLRKRLGGNAIVRMHQQSVLDMSLDRQADVVFSVGLVEHFDAPGTRQAVLAHFDVLRPGGTLILTFPRPTPLYRATRRLIEMLGMWKFHDERPLEPAEVLAAVRDRGDVVYQKTLWPLILTQHLIVARKRA